jgi:hypothetical protein
VTELLTASAAVAAAIFSFVNVVVSNRLARSSQVQQWRRDSERKIISDVLDAIRDVDDYLHNMIDEINALERNGDLDFQVQQRTFRERVRTDLTPTYKRAKHLLGELELVASVDCTRAAHELFEQLSDLPVDIIMSGEGEVRENIYRDYTIFAEAARERFVRACRADLGVGHRRRRLRARLRFRAHRDDYLAA